MAQGHRPDRVADQIRQELSELLSRGTVHDPGIGFITLTRVQVSPDLQMARVFYTSLGSPEARRETERARGIGIPARKHLPDQLCWPRTREHFALCLGWIFGCLDQSNHLIGSRRDLVGYFTTGIRLELCHPIVRRISLSAFDVASP